VVGTHTPLEQVDTHTPLEQVEIHIQVVVGNHNPVEEAARIRHMAVEVDIHTQVEAVDIHIQVEAVDMSQVQHKEQN
jgi:hypothetical protein